MGPKGGDSNLPRVPPLLGSERSQDRSPLAGRRADPDDGSSNTASPWRQALFPAPYAPGKIWSIQVPDGSTNRHLLAQVRSTQGNPENPNREVRARGVSVFRTNPNQIKARCRCLAVSLTYSLVSQALCVDAARGTAASAPRCGSPGTGGPAPARTPTASRTCSRAHISGPSRPAVAKLQEPPDGFQGLSDRSHRRHQEATRLRPGGGGSRGWRQAQ